MRMSSRSNKTFQWSILTVALCINCSACSVLHEESKCCQVNEIGDSLTACSQSRSASATCLTIQPCLAASCGLHTAAHPLPCCCATPSRPLGMRSLSSVGETGATGPTLALPYVPHCNVSKAYMSLRRACPVQGPHVHLYAARHCMHLTALGDTSRQGQRGDGWQHRSTLQICCRYLRDQRLTTMCSITQQNTCKQSNVRSCVTVQ